jgi:cell division protein FtsL
MTGEAFEYAIKKDVRNNPIVREIDRERHREMWRSAGVGVFLVFVLVLFVWRHMDILHQDVESNSVQTVIDDLKKQNEQLRIQIEATRAPAQIYEKARHTLNMVLPGPGDLVEIERAVTSRPASSSLARR